MPRYLIERTFPGGLRIPIDDTGRKTVASMIDTNAGDGVTWLHSYVSDDLRRSYCVYDAPSPEAVRRAAQRNGLPVDSITEVCVLEPYFYAAGSIPNATTGANALSPEAGGAHIHGARLGDGL